jgi:hypothetical protein
MSELDETVDGVGTEVAPSGVPMSGGEPDPGGAGGDPGGEVARRIRAVLQHGLDDGTNPVA